MEDPERRTSLELNRRLKLACAGRPTGVSEQIADRQADAPDAKSTDQDYIQRAIFGVKMDDCALVSLE